jgi:Rrf2 family transcriptional regulator, cysteine metabolism repressor
MAGEGADERKTGRGSVFPAKIEYACVAMLELAVTHGDPTPRRLRAIAEKHDISHRFLVQILLQLKGAGLVASTRGAAGGYHLGRTPDKITIADIVDAIDPPESETTDEALPTSLTRAIQSVWVQVVDAQRKVLESITLADLILRAQADYDLVYQI